MTSSTKSSAPGATEVPRHNPWLALVTLCLGFFMILLDTTIVNIAIPDMIDKLGAPLDQILWVINAYLLAYAVLLITAGRLGDLFGPKQMFILGLVIFTLASAACGFAHTPGQLIAARVAQAVGGALLTPQTLSVITMIFPPDRRGAAFGIWGAVAGTAAVAGPTLGGFIVTHWGWSWIFYVNLPVGIVTLTMAALFMPNLQLNRRPRLDLIGTALVCIGLFLVSYGLIEGQAYDWGKAWGQVTISMIIGAGLAVLALFVGQQYLHRKGEPLVPFAIFADRNFSVMNFVVAAMSFGMLGLFLPLVIYMQSVLGLSALGSGLAIAPMPLVSMFVAPFAGKFADRIGGKFILMAGLGIFATGMSILLWSASANSTALQLLPGLAVAGVGMGLIFAPLQTEAMRNVEPRMAGAAAGVITTTRQLGAVIGGAAVGALLQNQLAVKLASAAQRNSQALPEQFRAPFVAGFQHAAGRNLEVGAGQTGTKLPAGLPDQAKQLVLDAIAKTFHEGFTAAMRTSLILPIALLAVASLLCLLVKGRPRNGAPTPQTEPSRAEEPPAEPSRAEQSQAEQSGAKQPPAAAAEVTT
jgi:EmrB/QacA subfamily drug resistance transporter